jgi:hypothetical protein
VADGLAKLMQKEVAQGNIRELHICRRAPGISHLLFTNETLLFLEASGEEATKIKQVLREYEQGIGQLINPAKCYMMFGSACSEDAKVRVKATLNVDIIVQEEKYLGLLTPEGRMKRDQFRSTKERLSKRREIYVWRG